MTIREVLSGPLTKKLSSVHAGGGNCGLNGQKTAPESKNAGPGSPRGGGIGSKVAQKDHFKAGGSIGWEPNRWSGLAMGSAESPQENRANARDRPIRSCRCGAVRAGTGPDGASRPLRAARAPPCGVPAPSSQRMAACAARPPIRRRRAFLRRAMWSGLLCRPPQMKRDAFLGPLLAKPTFLGRNCMTEGVEA